jgi:hypothetical protein
MAISRKVRMHSLGLCGLASFRSAINLANSNQQAVTGALRNEGVQVI